MKKLLLFAVFGALFSGLNAQNPFSGYETSKTTGVAAHEFGASATMINLTQEYDQLELRWIGKDGLCQANDYLTATPTTRSNNIEIGFDFPFAEKTMKYCGFTAGGMLYFGESDALAPAVNLKSQTATKASDYVLFILAAFKSKTINITWDYKSLTAGENACVRYERVLDTFFIAYENLQIEDIKGNVLTVSFQYAFDKSGKLSFRPVSMTPAGVSVSTGDDKGTYYWGYSLGLVANNGGALCFIKKDGTKYTAKADIDITNVSHPVAGESYNFVSGSNECVAVASPQVTWDYDVKGTSLVLNPANAMTWNAEAPSALFVLSTENPLTGANLPVNGTVYANGSTIGSSAFVTTGTYNKFYSRNYFQVDTKENLESSTTYYLYAFPYNNENCGGGPIYNTTTIPSQSFRTNYKEPDMRVKTVSKTGAELQVAVDEKATRYMLAFDTLQLDAQTDMKVDETKTYAAGDKIAFGNRNLTVLEPCAATSNYTLTGLKQGTDYYYYAWSVNPERNWYSRGVARCGVAPLRSLPATINFAPAAAVNLKLESGNLPAGWEEASNNTYEYALREVLGRKVLSVQSTGYGVANPSDPSKLAIELSNSAILSPYVHRGTGENVKATIELVFWGLNGNEVISSSLKTTDAMIVECEDADGQWQEITKVKSGSGAVSLGGGVYHVTIATFAPKEVFRLRFTVQSTTELPDETSHTTYFAGISNITIESLSEPGPDPSCAAALYLQVVDGSLSSDGATLSWTDENEIAPLEYNVLYKEEAEEVWNVYPTTRTNVQLTGLQAGSSYTAMVKTFCTVEDSALSSPITFTIPSCGAPSLVRATRVKSTSADLSWRGDNLGYAVIYAPRVDDAEADTLYTEQTSLSLTGLTPSTPYEVYVVGYCGEGYTSPSDPSATAYFNTSILCTAPELTVVEGSVTWQGVHIAIKAPVSDCEVVIQAKEMEKYPAEYDYVATEDTLKVSNLIDYENITYIASARSLCTVDTSGWSEPVEFTTLPKSVCGEPSALQASVDESGRAATVSWTAGENNLSWLLMHKEKDAQDYDSLEVQETSSTFSGLKPNTVYTWRVQAACDNSLYSTIVYGEFTTPSEPGPGPDPDPDCGDPSNLQAWVGAGGRTATVSWTVGENNLSWLLMHKEKDAQKYESLEVREPFSTLSDLKPNTVYTWRVQAVCGNSSYSTLVYGEFTTPTDASLSSAQFADRLRMRVDANQIEIGNADGVYIKMLEVFSVNGKRLKTYEIHSSDNILIPHTLPFGPAVFRITGEGGQTAIYKWMIK